MDCDFEELYKWVEEHPITRPKRNINRDFSDALPLVEILKQHYPKLVDLHNYSPKNSHSQKMINWDTVNMKVLRKIKLPLTKKRMDALAKGEPGAIEKLLMEIKRKVETEPQVDDDVSEVIYLEENPTKAHQHHTSPHPKRTISVASYDKLQQDLSEKSEAIEILKSKVEHLDDLLNIKEERIKDLTQQLQTIVNQQNQAEAQPVLTSKFFSLF